MKSNHMKALAWAPMEPRAPQGKAWRPGAADLPRRIIGRPTDFLKIAPGPIFGPRGGENRIPREKIFRFRPFS